MTFVGMAALIIIISLLLVAAVAVTLLLSLLLRGEGVDCCEDCGMRSAERCRHCVYNGHNGE